jgi:hypothetical protein
VFGRLRERGEANDFGEQCGRFRAVNRLGAKLGVWQHDPASFARKARLLAASTRPGGFGAFLVARSVAFRVLFLIFAKGSGKSLMQAPLRSGDQFSTAAFHNR